MAFPQDLVAALRKITGPDSVIADEADMAPFLTDWRRLFQGKAACVVRPRTTEEVSAIIRECVSAGVAVVPQGGNTGLAGGATPDASGTQVVLSLSRMNAIRDIDPTGLCVEVEAGAILQTVREAVAGSGRLLPISIAAEGSATIGGVVSTNAGGLNVLRYGMTREQVLGLEVVLADGTIVNGLRRLRKDNAGQDWKQLFIGTEGSLGIVTAAVLRLVPRPAERSVAFVSVANIQAALMFYDHALSIVGEALSAFELISTHSLDLVARHFHLSSPLQGGEWYLLVEAASSLPGMKESTEALLENALEKGWIVDGVVTSSEAQAAAIWALREHVTEAEAREGRSLKHDVSVPLRAMPGFLDRLSAELRRGFPNARPNIFGHLGDGNLHVNVILSPDAEGNPVMRMVHDLVVDQGGSISAEHGLGQYRLKEWQRLRPAPERALVAKIKDTLDPRGLLNPGKATIPMLAEERAAR